jgi:hypothetical protein
LRTHDNETWWSSFVAEAAGNIAKKMTFGDAVLLREGENYNVEAIVIWNTKDFLRRTRLGTRQFLEGFRAPSFSVLTSCVRYTPIAVSPVEACS